MTNIKEWLKQARDIQEELIQLKTEKQKIWDELVNITGSLKERVQTSSVGQSDQRVLKYMEYDQLITQKMMELMAAKTEIEAVIEKVPKSKYRRLLRYYYISGYTWEETAEAMSIDVRSVYRMHGQALLCVEEVKKI